MDRCRVALLHRGMEDLLNRLRLLVAAGVDPEADRFRPRRRRRPRLQHPRLHTTGSSSLP